MYVCIGFECFSSVPSPMHGSPLYNQLYNIFIYLYVYMICLVWLYVQIVCLYYGCVIQFNVVDDLPDWDLICYARLCHVILGCHTLYQSSVTSLMHGSHGFQGCGLYPSTNRFEIL